MDGTEIRKSKIKEWWSDWHIIVITGMIVGLVGVLYHLIIFLAVF